MVKSNKQIKCDKCGKFHSSRNTIFFKSKYLCVICRQKNSATDCPIPIMYTLKEALEKVYKINISFGKGGKYAYCRCYFPKILAGKKVKLVLVEEEIKI